MTIKLSLIVLCVMVIAAACSPAESDQPGSGLLDPTQAGGLTDIGEEYRAFGECMREKGWDVTVREDGVAVDDTAPGQRAVAATDATECQETLVAVGISPDPNAPPSEEHVRAVYDAALEIYACLVDNGYPVPAIPSWESYLDTRLSGSEEDRWSPTSALTELDDDESRREAHVLCADENGG